MSQWIRQALFVVIAGVGALVAMNMPSCEGGGALLVKGEWRTFSELAQMSMDWPRVEATVIESRIEYPTRSSRTTRTGKERALVRYKFRVDDKSYRGKHVKFRVPSKTEAREWVKAYPEGTEITVSYYPEDPGVSVIAPGP